MSACEWSAWAAWVAAVATVVAVGAAIYAGMKAKELAERESRRDKRIEDADRRSQASLVAAWIEQRPGQAPLGVHDRYGNEKLDEFDHPVLCWRNASPVPIYELHATFTYNGDVLGTTSRAVFRPNDEVEVRMLAYDAAAVQGARVSEVGDSPENWRGWYQRGAEAGHLRVAIRFRDSQNHWWTRDKRGVLGESVEGRD